MGRKLSGVAEPLLEPRRVLLDSKGCRLMISIPKCLSGALKVWALCQIEE